MKAQVALEYIIIVGIVLAFLIPVWSYLAAANTQASESLAASQAQAAAQKIASAADLVYTQGPPSQIKTEVFFPNGMSGASLNDSTVIIQVYSAGSVSDVVATSLANFTGSIPQSAGLYQLTIKAVNQVVDISF